MSTLQLQELFPCIPYATLSLLYWDSVGNIEKMLDVLTVDQSKSEEEKEEEEEEAAAAAVAGYFL